MKKNDNQTYQNKKFLVRLGLIILFLFITMNCFAEEIENNTEKKEEESNWAIFPVVASSAETGFQYGVLYVKYFDSSDPNIYDSSVQLILIGTTNSQYQFILSPDFYFNEGFNITGDFYGNIWPANYYGIGNNSPDDEDPYESINYEMDISLIKKIFEKYFIGINYRYLNEDIEPSDDGLLEEEKVTGYKGGISSGIGLVLGYDTRDNKNASYTGTLIQYNYLVYDLGLGSDFNYEVNEIKLCKYFQTGKKSTIAFAGYFRSAEGDVPFRDLSSPDGTDNLRGIENGRYRDNKLLSLQSEFRFPFIYDFGFTIFAESAQVAEEMKDFSSDEFKYSIGFGIRYELISKQRFNIRCDISWVDDGFGLVVNVREAF